MPRALHQIHVVLKRSAAPWRADEGAARRAQHKRAAGAIDLETQSVTGPDQSTYSFEIDPFDKHRLLNGLDDVGLTLKFEDKIDAFKAEYQQRHSWAMSS